YAIGGRRWRVRLPAAGGALRVAYTACNGMEGERTWSERPARNERWRHLAAEHARAPFHLLLHGGDQLYADSMWREVPALAAWQRLPARRRLAAPFPPEMAEAVGAYFFARYRWLWRQPEVAPLLAEIPSLMMWDDHDIFDGWGSHDPEWQACPVFRGIYAAAREHFALFQLGVRPDGLPPDEGFIDPGGAQFGWAHRALEGVGIVAPDLRSERSRDRVMGEAAWRGFVAALECMADCRHVLLLSSVPAVNAATPWVERLYEALPGHQYFQLDLRDQWRSISHRDEWLRLIRHLLAFSGRTGARVTALSGEIHLGAFAVAEGGGGGGARIYQLTSSGIVHPPPRAPLVALMDWLSTGPAEEVEPGLAVKILPIPGLGKRFLRARNWLALELPAAGDGLAATWHSDASSFSVRLPPGAGHRGA
ncbi:MAG TPA: alkaline phosphatase D family protein, partial [Geminicoccaceae bacterium]|nr:alkaline phosphatase D family protein [Geminicoccaceae bacterium]